MEVHPPDHPVMTWKQFFIHMAIVVLGLLIAIGLEQGVELLHRKHQREDVREGLNRDLEEITSNSELMYTSLGETLVETQLRIAQAQTALATRQPLARENPGRPLRGDIPFDATFRAAQSGGLLPLLSQSEIIAFTELDVMVNENRERCVSALETIADVSSFSARFGNPSNEPNSWSQASPEDLRSYLAALLHLAAQLHVLINLARAIHGASAAMGHGERDLAKIYAAERSPVPAH